MARHRAETSWSLSRARHRGPGTVERYLRRQQAGAVAGMASLMLAMLLLWSTPDLEHRL